MRRISISRLLVRCFFTLSLVLAAPRVSALDNQFGSTDCECYNAEDCNPEVPDDALCRGYGFCEKNGKSDGTCLEVPFAPSTPGGLLDQAVGLYLEAYLVAISSGEGRPSVEILTEAQAVKLSEVQHDEAREAVHLALDAVIGFDFDFPRAPGNSSNPGKGVSPSNFGNIRGTPDGAAAIAEAARAGMSQAILTRNLNAIAGPLEAFWAAHPDFHPNHTGRLYPHGHADYEETVGTPLTGQVDTLRRILLHLLSDGTPLCGNNVLEGTEACDGSDDSACSAVCSADCTCGFIP